MFSPCLMLSLMNESGICSLTTIHFLHLWHNLLLKAPNSFSKRILKLLNQINNELELFRFIPTELQHTLKRYKEPRATELYRCRGWIAKQLMSSHVVISFLFFFTFFCTRSWLINVAGAESLPKRVWGMHDDAQQILQGAAVGLKVVGRNNSSQKLEWEIRQECTPARFIPLPLFSTAVAITLL